MSDLETLGLRPRPRFHLGLGSRASAEPRRATTVTASAYRVGRRVTDQGSGACGQPLRGGLRAVTPVADPDAMREPGVHRR